MSKIILTKKQAEFIEGFKKKYRFGNEDKVEIAKILPTWASQALHNLMQFGFGKGLEDANGKEASNDFYDKEDDFNHNKVPLLIEAVMHGYEVKEENVVLFIEFSDHEKREFSGKRKLYYGDGIKTTRRATATWYNLSFKSEAEQVEELKAQGWKVEKVK